MKEVVGVGADAIVAGNSLGGFTALAAASHAPNSIKVRVVERVVEPNFIVGFGGDWGCCCWYWLVVGLLV